MKSFVSSLKTSFGHALRGLGLAVRTERSFRIQIACGILVIVLIVVFPLHTFERILILLAMAAVLVLELLNSMVERLVDLVKPRLHEYVGDIKDLMAATVFVAAVAAAVIGAIVFWPHAFQLFVRL